MLQALSIVYSSRVFLGVLFAIAAVITTSVRPAIACLGGPGPLKWDSRIAYKDDSSFYNQNRTAYWKGSKPKKLGTAKYLQFATWNSRWCKQVDTVILVDCATAKSIQIFGRDHRPLINEDGSREQVYVDDAVIHHIDQYFWPDGPIDILNPELTLETVKAQAKSVPLRVIDDFWSYQQTLRYKNRIDPFRICERLFPNLNEAG